ncbi:MAG: hypothetical protein LUC83_03925, partial [Clostridiales bacterium]|nr:hypothetical protein [Clostridiales bacterium]
ISTNAKKLMTAYAKILLALECDMDDSSKRSLESARDSIKELWTNYLTYTASQNTDYEKILYQYQKAADTSYDSIKNQSYTFSSAYCGSSVTVAQFFSQVKSNYNALVEKLEAQLNTLDIILNGGYIAYDGFVRNVKSLDQVRTLLEEYIEKRDDWGDEAHGASTSYAVEEQAEYDGGEENALARELAEKGVVIIDD